MANKKNYSKISTEKVKLEPNAETMVKSTLTPEVTNEVETPKEEPTQKKVKKGIVTGCVKLNVRNNPHPNAVIERTIDQRTEVEITDSHGDYYHVRSGTVTNGFSGWCMKKYITVKK